MDGSYDGRQIVGMDLNRRRSVLVRMTGDGRRLDAARIENSPAGLRAEIAKAADCPRVMLEATYRWYWAADALAEAGAEVHLLGVRAFSYRAGQEPTRKTLVISRTCCGWGVCPRRGSARRRSASYGN